MVTSAEHQAKCGDLLSIRPSVISQASRLEVRAGPARWEHRDPRPAPPGPLLRACVPWLLLPITRGASVLSAVRALAGIFVYNNTVWVHLMCFYICLHIKIKMFFKKNKFNLRA